MRRTIWDCIKVFVYGFSIDFMSVLYVRGVQKNDYVLAVVANLLWTLPTLLGILSILANKKLITPYLVGATAGTVVSMLLFQ